MAHECDLLVIGAGPGGYVAALRAGKLGLKTILVEKENNLGGTCLNVGCIPSKTLLYYSEQLFEDKNHRSKHGLEFQDLSLNFSTLMQTKLGVVKGLNMGIGGLLKRNKVQHFVGTASFKSPTEVILQSENETQSIHAKHVIIATGSTPISLPSLPIDEKKIISSSGALSLESVPKNLVIIGAGVIGLELGSVYNRLGSQVTFVEALDHIGGNLQPEISSALHKTLTKQGLKFLLSHKFVSQERKGDSFQLTLNDSKGEVVQIDSDVILVSIGRKPYTEGLNLESAGIQSDEKGRVQINPSFQTSQSHIYAIGDVVEGPMLAHKASEEGVAVVEKIAGSQPKVNYLTIPNVMYTQPEVASVGFTAEEAKAHGLNPKIGKFPFMANSRAHCVDAKEGLVQIIVDEASDIIIGMHIMSEHAGEMIAIGSLAIEKKVTAKELGALCFPHPTFSEAIKEAALDVHKETIHF
ncbi:MAG: Dihydrolipoyl dehydrogenase [Chlamydiae bacterium]|nr:Dihydrolipoyl dehydrogenase [Chlamydiota bacterium]